MFGGNHSENAGSKRSGPWVPPSPEELAAVLPDYEIVRMLGSGGMGAVYLGRQSSLNRPVAIKILSTALDAADPSFAERFKNEAKALAKLNHPAIVKIHDFGERAEGLLYLVMEYVDGSDVARLIAARGRLGTEEAVNITRRVCDALAYAHDRGIIHRDIKPANLLAGHDGSVKVADFGLAKVCAEGQTLGLTMSGTAMGTMHFMAPEALEFGATPDHRADLYSLGVTLYQMLTGKLPKGLFELPSLLVRGLDPRLDGVVARCLQQDREMRYPSARDLRNDLDSIRTQPLPKEEDLPTLPHRFEAKPDKTPHPRPNPDPVAALPNSSAQWILWSVFGGGLLLTMIAVLALGPVLLVVLHKMDQAGAQRSPVPHERTDEGGSDSTPLPRATRELVTRAPLAPIPTGWTDLIVGDTLAGWEPVGDAVWKVENGVLSSVSGGYGILHRKLLSPWFELTGEVSTSIDGHGGIHLQMTTPRYPIDGMELTVGSLNEKLRMPGTVFPLPEGLADNLRLPNAILADETFLPFRVLLEPDSLKVWNGKRHPVDLTGKRNNAEARHLALSRWGHQGKVAFRNLRLRLIPPSDSSGGSGNL